MNETGDHYVEQNKPSSLMYENKRDLLKLFQEWREQG
jgi:hypothetical protein